MLWDRNVIFLYYNMVNTRPENKPGRRVNYRQTERSSHQVHRHVLWYKGLPAWRVPGTAIISAGLKAYGNKSQKIEVGQVVKGTLYGFRSLDFILT